MKFLALSITGGGTTYGITPPPQISNLMSILSSNGHGNQLNGIIIFAFNLLLTVAILLSFAFFLFGGIRWIMSQGDKKQLETAQKTIQYSLVGLIVILLSFFIINLLYYLFGIHSGISLP